MKIRKGSPVVLRATYHATHYTLPAGLPGRVKSTHARRVVYVQWDGGAGQFIDTLLLKHAQEQAARLLTQ